MNILESQFTDLDQLANSPLPDSVDYNINMNGRQSSSAESPAAQGGTKRKADGDGANANPDGVTHTRAKRNRYISIACNECKRRKIKCNGNTPCQRCGNLNLECQYAPNCCANGFKESEEFRQMNAKLSSLQEQVDNLYANLNAMRHEHTIHSEEQLAFPHGSERSMSIPQLPGSAQPISPASRRRSQSRYQSFRGPTSSTFSLDVAKNTLHSMGYQGLSDGNVTQDPTPAASPPSQPLGLLHANGQPPTRDPIWALSKDEVVRLCRVYEEEMGIMYPMLNIEELIIHGKNMYTFIDAALRTGLAKTTSPQGIHDIQTCILKMVLAVSLVVEGGGESELGYRLFESVRKIADRILHSEVFEITQLPLLVLVVSLYWVFYFACLCWWLDKFLLRQKIRPYSTFTVTRRPWHGV
ncbi:hypothetical protein B0O99DRAFT_517581 [Bisporella sp. PMI_857]|nr:hypothetical protein B0O99DRAFT_517581 [Bisporella sp. PMI_857]